MKQALSTKLCQTKPTNAYLRMTHRVPMNHLAVCCHAMKLPSSFLGVQYSSACLLAVACLGYVFLRRPLDLLFYGMALICFLCPLVVISAVLAAVKPPSGSAFKLDTVQDWNLRLGIGRSLTICKYFYAQVVQKLTFLGISFVVLSLHFV